MGEVAVISMPEEYAGAVSDWAVNAARMQVLQDGLLEAMGPVQGLIERAGPHGMDEKGRVDELKALVARINWFTDEIAALATAEEAERDGREVKATT